MEPDSPNDDHHLERMLDNYRDVKRFCNSIRINFEILKDDVEIIDLFLLELIKTKSFHLYEWVANKKLLQYAKQNNYTYTLNGDAWKLFETQSNLDNFTLGSLKRAIEYLVEKNDAKSIRQFTYPHNFYLYFTFQLFNLIPFRDFQKTIQLQWKEARGAFDVWAKEGKDRDLARILDSLTEFENKEQLEKFVKVFLAESGSNFTSRATKLLKDWQRTIPKYFANKETVNAFVIRILNDDELGEFNRAILANEFLKAYIYQNDEEKLIPKKTCQEIIYRLFDKFLSRQPSYTLDIFSFYVLNDDSRDENKYILLYPPANRRLRKFLLDANNFETFLRYTIRSYMQPNDGRFTLDPFTTQIFGDWNQFIEQARKHHPNAPDIKELMPFILEAADELSKGSQWFKLEGEKKEQIISYLRKNRQYNYDPQFD